MGEISESSAFLQLFHSFAMNFETNLIDKLTNKTGFAFERLNEQPDVILCISAST